VNKNFSQFPPIKTKITDLFGIRYPIIQAGMIWASGARLGVSVSNCGGLGLIGSGSMFPDELIKQIRWAKTQTRNLFGVNIPLMRSDADELVQICINEGMKIVFTSAGNPKKFTSQLKETGVKVVHVVPSAVYAKKAEAAGVDAIVAEGTEAGGHNGFEEITTMCLIPQVVDAVSVPLIAAGGIGDGRGMAAAFALGADAVQLGTRFALSEESTAHENYKKVGVAAAENATRLITKKLGPTRAILNPFAQQLFEAELNGASKEKIAEILGKGKAKAAIQNGDVEQGEIEIGQICGMIKEVKSVAEIMLDLLTEFQKTSKIFKKLEV